MRYKLRELLDYVRWIFGGYWLEYLKLLDDLQKGKIDEDLCYKRKVELLRKFRGE